MAWCKLDDTFCDDPKWDAIAEDLGCAPAAAAGHVALLYSWAVRHAPDGVLEQITDRAIARVSRFDGEARALVNALIKHGVIDDGEPREIHAYAQRSESFNRARQKKKERRRTTVARRSHDTTPTVAEMSPTERRGEEKRVDLGAFAPSESAPHLPVVSSTEIKPRSSLSSDAKNEDALTAAPSALAVPEKKKRRSPEQQERSKNNNRLYRELYEKAEGYAPSGVDQSFNGMMARFSDKYGDDAQHILSWVFQCPDKSFRTKGWPLELIIQQAPRLWRELNNPRAAVENIAAPRQQQQMALAASNDLAFEEYHRRKAERLANANQV